MLRGCKFVLKILSTLFALGVLVGAPGGGVVQAAPGMNPQHTNVVISEFRTRGPAGDTDEFIEIFNPTTNPIDISGWMIWEADLFVVPTTPFFTVPAGKILASGQHYLVANNSINGYSEAVPADGTYNSTSIPDISGIALTDSSEAYVDMVGTNISVAYHEGAVLAPLSGNSGSKL